MSKQVRRDFTDDFRREAVRLTQTSGRTIRQVADDLGIGLSTLTRWKRKSTRFELRLPPDLGDRIDEWRRMQDDLPTRAEAARRLIKVGLNAETANND